MARRNRADANRRPRRLGRTLPAPAALWWSPVSVAVWTFIFPVAGAVLYARNQELAGRPWRGRIALAALAVMVVVPVLLARLAELMVPPNVVAAVSVAPALTLYADTKRTVAEASASGGARFHRWQASLLLAAPIAAAGLTAIGWTLWWGA